MNAPAIIPMETLPRLIDRATAALENARTSAEVLEAREFARAAYDAAKSAGRMAKAKQAHDSIVSEVHRAQAHALAIRARAEMRLAEEYDDAQDRGEILGNGERSFSSPEKVSGTAIFPPKDLHEARQFRDAERADPGVIRRTIDSIVDRGEEPTRAALRKEVIERPKARVMDPMALWIWGRLKDFERDGILMADPSALISEMTEPMRADVRRLLPLVRGFIEDMECKI